MYRKEVNERSPMRVFEKSMHGGLGRGNVGAVAAAAGVGKTPLLVQIALDDLMRNRRVLHISHEHAVDHVRSYYSEIFHDLCVISKLDDAGAVKLDVERHRLIFSLMSSSDTAPMSARGGRSSITRILEAVNFAREVAHFEPDVIIIDGFDFMHGSDEALAALGELARVTNVELWLSANAEAKPAGEGELPAPLDRFRSLLNVVVFLDPEGDVVRLRLLKDHDNKELADLHLRLDPHTMRVVDEDVPPASERRRDPRRFRLVSGGCKGAEAAFGACAERWGMTEVHYSYDGHRYLARSRGVVVLSPEELKKGDFSLLYASRRLNRELTKIPFVRNVLQTIWHQITAASQVFAVGVVQDDGTVRGGTGWGAELARLWSKPLFVFDQQKRAWFRWGGSAWEMTSPPAITAETFAGIGTQSLNDDGRQAIEALFQRSFGSPVAE
jgi:archaellum biogenesis ATPase FlaH